MYLQSLELNNFRNHRHFEKEFSNDTIILLGPNTIGKTNIIEAIRFLSLFKSFRTSNSQDMIYWGENLAKVEGKINNQKVLKNIFGALLKKDKDSQIKREIKIDGAKISTRQAVGTIQTVIFSPEDIQLISSGPSKRRRYLDTVLGQLSQSYYAALRDYNRALWQRNMILSQPHQSSEIEIWEEQLAANGSVLISKRSAFIEEINKEIPGLYKSLAGAGDLRITYQPRFFEPGVEILLSREKIKQILLHSFQKSRPLDYRYKNTSTGPHRDDFNLVLNNRQIINHGSRGEWRSAILSLKVAEKNYIKKITASQPILLLDDVFSELDDTRRQALTDQIIEAQVFISTTDRNHLGSQIQKTAQLINLSKEKWNQ
jgi:DNA replication and repair protein RecF